MVTHRVEGNVSVFRVTDRRPFGMPDRIDEISIPHDVSERAVLAKGGGEVAYWKFFVPEVGMVGFSYEPDSDDGDWSSNTYRPGCYTVSGPYLLEDPIPPT